MSHETRHPWHDTYPSITQPADGLWTTTYASEIRGAIKRARYLKMLKMDFLKGYSNSDASQNVDGGFMFQVVGYGTEITPGGCSGHNTIFAEPTAANWDHTALSDGATAFNNRYYHVFGRVVYYDSPVDLMPGGTHDAALCDNAGYPLAGSHVHYLNGHFFSSTGIAGADYVYYVEESIPPHTIQTSIYLDNASNELWIDWNDGTGTYNGCAWTLTVFASPKVLA